ncbi:class I SAM-dependent methyltransferase [Burkholderia alba]|uniref:class I SAM-dependent methyltransferase n=1 Tax=Burkholderia alba TaxID=2683677 RepID=UPI002B054E79|nr:class I SAM-dependent methyltransferase [Burkholderia alba]
MTTYPSELYLQDFHARAAGATRRAFAHLRARSATADYASSYDALAAVVPRASGARTVLDLACGDGPLLERLAVRDPSLRLIGVDMSEGELDAARAVLPAHVTLLRERAQQLSIGTGTIDAVLAHMALMLMEDIDAVIGEIRRVLKPGGTFAAIVGRAFLLGDADRIFMDVFMPIAREALPPLPFGDARADTPEGWVGLLEAHFDDIRFEDFDIAWTPTPDALWDSLLETYDIDRLPAAPRERLRTQLVAALTPLLRDGRLQTGWGVRLIRARAK